MSYSSELEFATQVATALTYIISKIEEHQEEYPLLTKALFALIYGVMVESSVQCPHCQKNLSLKTKYPVGGIVSAVELLYDAAEALELELMFGGDEDAVSDAE